MSEQQWINILIAILQTGGIGTFLYFAYQGLKKKMEYMNETVDQQNKTLDVMEKRIAETEKIGSIYRNLLHELPDDIKKYKEIVSEVKDETIKELEKANKEKDERLKSNAEIRLKELDVAEQAINELPKLRDDFLSVIGSIQQRLLAFDSLMRRPNFLQSNRLSSQEYIPGTLHIGNQEYAIPADPNQVGFTIVDYASNPILINPKKPNKSKADE